EVRLQEKIKSLCLASRSPDSSDDGFEPISDAVFRSALYFATKLPELLLQLEPNVESDPDGYIELEWRKGRDSCSIYVTDRNIALFGAYFGPNDRFSGRFSLDRAIPQAVQQHIQQVYLETIIKQ